MRAMLYQTKAHGLTAAALVAAVTFSVAVTKLASAESARPGLSVELLDQASDMIRRGGRDPEAKRQRLQDEFNAGLQKLAETDSQFSEAAQALWASRQTIRIVCIGSREAEEANLTEGVGPLGGHGQTRGDFDEIGGPRTGGEAIIAIECELIEHQGLDTPLPFLGADRGVIQILVHKLLHATHEDRVHPVGGAGDDDLLYRQFETAFFEALERMRPELDRMRAERQREGKGAREADQPRQREGEIQHEEAKAEADSYADAHEILYHFPDRKYEPLYDAAGFFEGWKVSIGMRHVEHARGRVLWGEGNPDDIRNHFTDWVAVREPTEVDVAGVIAYFRDARGPLSMAKVRHPDGQIEEKYGSQHHVDLGEELFEYWINYGNQTADVLENRRVHRDEFEPFFAEFEQEERRLQQYIQLQQDRYWREHRCGRVTDDVLEPETYCGERRIRHRVAGSYTFDVLQQHGSEIFWAFGIDPWAYKEEVAATSRPTPLGGPELIALRYLREGEDGPQQATTLIFGEVFYVEAEYDTEPAEVEQTVVLEWDDAPPFNVSIRKTASPTIYRSGPLMLAPPPAGAELEIEP